MILYFLSPTVTFCTIKENEEEGEEEEPKEEEEEERDRIRKTPWIANTLKNSHGPNSEKRENFTLPNISTRPETVY